MGTSVFDRQVIRNLRSFGCTYEEIAKMTGWSAVCACRVAGDVTAPRSPYGRKAASFRRQIARAVPRALPVPRLPYATDDGLLFPTRAQLMAGR